jgi:hypothetical protein
MRVEAMEKTLIMVGIIDKEGYELDNRVYAGGAYHLH